MWNYMYCFIDNTTKYIYIYMCDVGWYYIKWQRIFRKDGQIMQLGDMIIMYCIYNSFQIVVAHAFGL